MTHQNAPDAGPIQPPSLRAARLLVAALIRHGMRDAVLCPGSRSAPLAYALADAEASGALRLHVRIDERTAGFLALGLARGAALTGRPAPVAVVTTSGTAVANLHPAILEAHHTGVPVLALTADRPHELRGTGANQTTDQVGLFGAAVRHAVDVPAPTGRAGEDRDVQDVATRAVAAALGTRSRYPGPVHLNLAYRDPLAPLPGGTEAAEGADGTGAAFVGDAPPGAPAVLLATAGLDEAAAAHPVLAVGPHEPPTVLVAGDGAGPGALELAERRGWPVLAEASSGAAGGANTVAAHRLVLGVESLTSSIRRVVVAGRPTLSRPVHALLARAEVDVLILAEGAAPWPDAARNATVVLPAVPSAWARGPEGPADHLARWRAAGAAAAGAVDAALDAGCLTGPHVARAVVRTTGRDGVLVVGSSNPVRDLDLVLGAEGPTVVANRGLAGIDGTLSTAAGVALATGRPVTVLLGDLTFLHDVGGLLRGPGEPALDLRIVVLDDDGGSIFATLEHGQAATDAATAARFERVFGTPHGADASVLAAGYGVPATRIDAVETELRTALDQLNAALAVPIDGVDLVHVRVGRNARGTQAQALAAAVRRACS